MDAAPRTTPIRLQPWEARSEPIVVGVGANQGCPERQFRAALCHLAESVQLCRVSPLYRSAPVGPAQPDFLNAAVLLQTELPLPELLSLLQAIEEDAGRVRKERWGPRPLDLDILWAGRSTISTSSLTVPHVELRQRSFALKPLVDVFPDACDPRTGESYVSILGKLEHQRCESVDEGCWWQKDDAQDAVE